MDWSLTALKHLLLSLLLVNLLSATAAAAVLPKDNQSFRIEIPGAGASVWLGTKPVQGGLSFTKSESSATRWRFHQQMDGSFTIESLDDGKRWLTLSSEGSIQLAHSDAALSSRWHLSLLDDQLLLENPTWPSSERFLTLTSKSASLGNKKDAETSPFILHLQDEELPPLAHGDVISIRSMAASNGRLWLDGNTSNGSIALASEADLLTNTGTLWRVHDNGDGSFSFECLGNIPGPRWLNLGATPTLVNTNDRGEATRWKVLPGPLGSVSFKNVSSKSQNPWLDSYPAIASTSLAATTQNNPGTAFQIRIRSSFNPEREGRWTAFETLPISGIHAHVLPNGKVLLWSRFQDPSDVGSTIEGVVPGRASTYIFDPLTASVTPLPNAEFDVFCGGHSFLADGRLLVSGGHIRSNVGLKSTQIFDYRTNSWESSPKWDMNQGRWYPTNITLANGDVITISGDATSGEDPNRIPQVWSATQKRWRDLSALASSCFNATSGPCMPLYPWLHLIPNGKIFVSGPGQDTGYIDTEGEGQWIPLGKTKQGYRGDYEASSVMYAPGKILISGGIPSTNSVETIDLNARDPQWTPAAPMTYKRHKHSMTILADGQVLVSGGSSADGSSDNPAVYAAEIWNPDTGQWSEGDHLSIPRLYHSTAVLLPDGRVLSMGGGLGAGFNTHKNMEIYSPPYLFKGPRPSLATQDDTIHYGQQLSITTPEAQLIAKVHLIRLSSDTHSFNSGQQIVPLTFQADKKSLRAAIPSSGAEAPPGHYLLFIVNKAGVPSLGKTLQLLPKEEEATQNKTAKEIETRTGFGSH